MRICIHAYLYKVVHCENQWTIFVFIIPPGEGGHLFYLLVMSESLLQSSLFHEPCCALSVSHEMVPRLQLFSKSLKDVLSGRRCCNESWKICGEVKEQRRFCSRHNKHEINGTL